MYLTEWLNCDIKRGHLLDLTILSYRDAKCFNPYSRVDKEKNELGRWKSRIVAIFLLFLTLWHVLTYKQADATLASLSILKYGALKWPHRVIRGSKIKTAAILFKSRSDRRPWLKNSKNVFIFSNATRGSDIRCCKRWRVSIQIVQGSKN